MPGVFPCLFTTAKIISFTLITLTEGMHYIKDVYATYVCILAASHRAPRNITDVTHALNIEEDCLITSFTKV